LRVRALADFYYTHVGVRTSRSAPSTPRCSCTRA